MNNEVMNNKAIKASSRLLLVGGGGGGGTGKTTLSIALVDYFTARHIPVVLIDAESEPKPKGRLRCYFPEALELNIHSNSTLDKAGSPAVNERKLTLVDLGAGAGPRVLEWLRKTLVAFRRQTVPITLLCPVTSAPQTLTCVVRWVNELQDAVSYLMVKNDRDQGGFAHLDSPTGTAFRTQYRPLFINLAYRNPDIYSILEGKNLSPGQALELYNRASIDGEARERLGVLDDAIIMAHIESDRDQIFEQFDSVIDLLIPEQIDIIPNLSLPEPCGSNLRVPEPPDFDVTE